MRLAIVTVSQVAKIKSVSIVSMLGTIIEISLRCSSLQGLRFGCLIFINNAAPLWLTNYEENFSIRITRISARFTVQPGVYCRSCWDWTSEGPPKQLINFWSLRVSGSQNATKSSVYLERVRFNFLSTQYHSSDTFL